MKTSNRANGPLASLLPILSYVGAFILGSLTWGLLSHLNSPSLQTTPHQSHDAQTLPTKRMIFDRIPALETLSHDGDKHWGDLVTKQGGFLWVQHNETYGYPWGISMFHGLHCLAMIRSALQDASGNATGMPYHEHNQQTSRRNDGHDGEHKTHESHAAHAKNMEHVMHCFSYIAQSLQCSADGTIEKPVKVKYDENHNMIDNGRVNGLGIHHVCRNPEQLWRVAKESEDHPVAPWEWSHGDTVQRFF